MTRQQDVSFLCVKDIALTAIANGLCAENLHDHLVGNRMICIAGNFLGVLLHEAQDIIDLN